MDNRNLKHMAYYTRKVAEQVRNRRNVRHNKYRHNRLLQYKEELNKRLQELLKK